MRPAIVLALGLVWLVAAVFAVLMLATSISRADDAACQSLQTIVAKDIENRPSVRPLLDISGIAAVNLGFLLSAQNIELPPFDRVVILTADDAEQVRMVFMREGCVLGSKFVQKKDAIRIAGQPV